MLLIHSRAIYSRKNKMKARTTINIKKEIRKALNDVKQYPRETYDDVLLRLVEKQLKLKKKFREIK